MLWTQNPDKLFRGTVSTAGAAQLALELYQQTHDQKYLDFGKKQFEWVDKTLKDSDGLYFDGINEDGKIEGQKYSYNQGLMLGDATLLYKATGDAKYLKEAQDIARASLDAFTGDRKAGGPEPLAEQAPFFNAAFFKNLMLLDSVAPDPSYRQALADYSKYMAEKVDPESGLITVKGKKTLQDQASAVQIFALAEQNPV